MGAAFYLWGARPEAGRPSVIGVIANATPMLSTAMLAMSGRGTITATLLVAALLVSAASLVALLANPLREAALASKRHDGTTISFRCAIAADGDVPSIDVSKSSAQP
jgi:hypothetical protein